jgi:hypothetical protein
MPITGSAALATVAAPAANSPTPYTIYKVTNPTGIVLYGFILQNTANIPVTLTIYQDNYNNSIYSVTLAANQAATQIILNASLAYGEQILALANQGGVVNIEVDGIINVADPISLYLLALILMWNQTFGTDIPSQSMLNAGALSLT